MVGTCSLKKFSVLCRGSLLCVTPVSDQTEDENGEKPILASYISTFLGFGECLKHFHLGIRQMDVLT